MTVEQLHNEFNQRLQKIGGNAVEGFQLEEIDNLLNEAQLQIIRDRFTGVNEPGFEQTQGRVDDLQTIVETGINLPVLDASGVSLGSNFEHLLPYPGDYMFYVSAELEITRTNYPPTPTKTHVPIQPVKNEDLKKYRITPYHNPHITIPGGIFKADFIHCFVDQETRVHSGRMTYVRLPDTIKKGTTPSLSIQAELPEHMHDEIVNLAVILAFSDLQGDFSKRNQLETEQA